MQQAGAGGGSQSPQSHLAAEAVEAASPISSRPPASTTVNLDEFMALSGSGGAGGGSVFGGGDDEALAMAAAVAEADRGGGLVGGSSGSGGNRWPRPETLALLKIRSEMDAIFRDATLKGPLWEDVSRKMAELGYKRNAKKCKEKFENVHKYYKRTKEGRAGRQDGKSYKFFSQLEALHGNVSSSQGVPTTTVTPSAAQPTPVSVTVNPIPISSFRASPSHLLTNPSQPPPTMDIFPRDHLSTPPPMPISAPPTTATTSNFPPMGVSFSSNSCSSLPGSDDDDENTEGEAPFEVGSSRKRKRDSSKRGGSSTHRMMEFFEKLMKQVMQKQETMQQKFVQVIEKREQERMIREEAWKRQEMARMSREHEVIAQERALSASRDSAIVSFLQKITGQTIPLPTQLPPVAVNLHAVPSPVVVQPAPSVPTPAPPPPMHQQQYQQQLQVVQVNRQSADQQVVRYQPSASSEPVMAVPERQVAPQDYNTSGAGSSEKGSSRWPKTEVLALINLRSGMETKYQESGPKGPLWEEISAGMQQLGYKRSAKRCKEKWENINKYFKKVKESNKRRPEDSKTCPYFHQLDALYRQKVFGGSSTTGGESSSGGGSLYNQNRPEQQQQQQQEENIKLDSTPVSQPQQQPQSIELENRNTSNTDVQIMSNLAPNLFGESSTGGAVTNKKPEDIVKQLMDQHEQEETQQQLEVDDYDKIDDEADSDNIDDQEEEDEDTEELEDDESNKMDYKIEFQQRQNTTGPSNDGAGNGTTPSFFAMVQ